MLYFTKPLHAQKILIYPVIILFLLSTVAPATLRAQATASDEEVSLRFQKVGWFRTEGRYDEAIQELRAIINEYSNTEEVLRRSYNELVQTIHQQLNAAEDAAKVQLERQREEQARETLRRYPDIKADVGYKGVDELYNELRAEMFSSLVIITDPDSCDVMIDGEHCGRSPFRDEYFPVGTHAVRIIQSGYEEQEVTVEVEPSKRLEKEIVLAKIRGRGWWLTWVVAPVAIGVGVVLAVALGTSDDTSDPPPDEPLPQPPDPPTN